MAGNVAALVLAMVISGLAWAAWRVRALRAHQRRSAREWDSIGQDAADLLAAALTNLDLACEEAPAPSPLLDDTSSAIRALAGLLAAARPDAEGRRGGHANTEGCVRVAIAIARSREHGVRLSGSSTALPVHGSSAAALEALTMLLDALRSAAPRSYTEVILQRDRVLLRAPAPSASSLASSWVPAAVEPHLERCGWSLRALDDRTWEISARPPTPDRSLARARSGVDG